MAFLTPHPVPTGTPATSSVPACTPAPADTHSAGLLLTNQLLIGQALTLVAWHLWPHQRPYPPAIGAHLRHVIEHCEALLWPASADQVFYDGRARDAALERCPRLARQRLLAIQAQLGTRAPTALDAPIALRGLAGLDGALVFAVPSTWGRELAFLASHTVHHFALIKALCLRESIPLGDGFGLAPATIAHARQPTNPGAPAAASG